MAIEARYLPEFLLIATLAANSRKLPAKASGQWEYALGSASPPIDEKAFVALTMMHKLERSVSRGLQQDSSIISSETTKKLKAKALKEGSLKQSLLQDWMKIHQALESHQIPSLVIKGPASSVQLYGDVLERGYTDLDILVDTPSLVNVIPGMQEAGYTLKLGQESVLAPPDTGKIASRLLQKSHHLVFIREDSPYRVEVHNTLYDQLPHRLQGEFGTHALFQRRVLLTWKDVVIPTLSLPDHALFIIDHGTRHAWCLLHWLFDVAAILHNPDPAFHQQVYEGLRTLGHERQLAVVAPLVKEFFELAIPSVYNPLLEKIQQRYARQTKTCYEQLLPGARTSTSVWHSLRTTYLYRLPLAGTWSERWQVMTQLFLVSPQDAVKLRLPTFLMPLHLVLRPFFVIQRRFERMISKLRRRSGQA